MRITLRSYGRLLRLEALEHRALMSATPLAASVPPTALGAAALQSTAASPGDMVIPIHAQIGGSALETVLGIAAKIDTIQQALTAYLNEMPGWHLTGGFDRTPAYTGKIDGSVVVGANGLLRSANVTLTGSADIAAGVEGYYGISVLHVGVGAAADLSANVSATASYSVDTNAWYFGGSTSLVGYVKGYGAATAWPLRGEVYIRGDLSASAAIDSNTGIASASVAMTGSVGVDAQMKSLFGGWTTIASASRTLGSWRYGATFDVGAWMKSEVTGVVAANQTATVAALAANVAHPAADLAMPTLSPVSAVQTVVMTSVSAVAAAPTAGGSVAQARVTVAVVTTASDASVAVTSTTLLTPISKSVAADGLASVAWTAC
jgi:hypothetical protein